MQNRLIFLSLESLYRRYEPRRLEPPEGSSTKGGGPGHRVKYIIQSRSVSQEGCVFLQSSIFRSDVERTTKKSCLASSLALNLIHASIPFFLSNIFFVVNPPMPCLRWKSRQAKIVPLLLLAWLEDIPAPIVPIVRSNSKEVSRRTGFRRKW